MYKKNLFLLFFICSFTYTFGQSVNTYCQDFEFTRNLQKGSSGQDVLVLQKILNQDSRTQIAKSGVGSKGQETRLFGEKTRDALKKFQALFIEYTKVADGVFQGETKVLINNMCNNKGLPKFLNSSTSAVTKFFSTTTVATNTLELIDPNFDYFLDQMPSAYQLEPKIIIDKYLRKLINSLYPPQLVKTPDSASSTLATSTQATTSQVTVSSVPF